MQCKNWGFKGRKRQDKFTEKRERERVRGREDTQTSFFNRNQSNP